ncbi:hypothetical protein Glove_150g24 [Diversispora epigaea]|uniref:Uncharacterized protein n=1 Tax=Diversispora epigaea TaxID=1348612 RepID=A0A397J2F1_9GLOM|nr:hypothetical protein Glove_150g24 [Diversispora epigaea]
MSAVRKTKKKFQSPRSKFTYVRNSKNNPSNLNTSHNHFDNMFNEDNLQEYFDKFGTSSRLKFYFNYRIVAVILKFNI